MKETIFIFISFIIGLFLVRYIRSYDLHEKEPFIKMFAVTLWGGVWSIVICSILYGSLHSLGITDIKNTIGALFVIGPVEELSKLLALLSSYFIIREELNEPTDGIIYMACVALGFSLIENYFYAIKDVNSGYLLFLRLFISTPMHIFFSVFMGFSFYVWLQNKSLKKIIFLSFLYASLVHGVFDLIIFNAWSIIFLLIIMKVAHSFVLSLLNYTTAKSPFKPSLLELVTSYKNPELKKGIECLNCGSKNKKITYNHRNIFIQKCDECEYYLTTKTGIFNIFRYFASPFKKISNEHYLTPFITGKKFATLYSDNYISEEKNLAYFNLDKLSSALDKLTFSMVSEMDKKWWFPKGILENNPKNNKRTSITQHPAARDSAKISATPE